MRIGVIDFGTNTLRLDIFETDEQRYQSIFDYAIYSRIVENTVGTSLCQDGIEHIIQAIEEHQQACRHYRCDRVECFSTASLRYIDNADDVLEQVFFRTGIKIRMISGDEEARYDYLALKSVVSEEKGIGCDLGGGSFQIFTFDENGPIKSESFPLGSSRTSKRFVKGSIPTENEVAAIKECVSSSLSESGFGSFAGETLFAMGGTAKAIKSLYNTVISKGDVITLKELDLMIKLLCEKPDEAVELISDIAPKRIKTLVPGMCVLSSAMKKNGCDKMKIYPVGVREGFLETILSGELKKEPTLLDIIMGNI